MMAVTWDVLCYDTVDSTNNVCKALAAQGLDSTAVIARAQTAGKGRLGRSFQSPEGGLYLSVLWRNCPAEQLLTVTPLAAVAVCRAVESLCDTDCGIKWCNDVVLHGKKLCGILTELSVSLETQEPEYVVIGIGINCNQTQFPQELDMATSLRIEAGRPADVNAIAAALLLELSRMRREFLSRKSDWIAAFSRNCLTVGKDIQILRAGTIRQAKATGIGPDAELLVEYPDGTSGSVSSGEVSVRGLYGYV